jgi:hypothetical protein
MVALCLFGSFFNHSEQVGYVHLRWMHWDTTPLQQEALLLWVIDLRRANVLGRVGSEFLPGSLSYRKLIGKRS